MVGSGEILVQDCGQKDCWSNTGWFDSCCLLQEWPRGHTIVFMYSNANQCLKNHGRLPLATHHDQWWALMLPYTTSASKSHLQTCYHSPLTNLSAKALIPACINTPHDGNLNVLSGRMSMRWLSITEATTCLLNKQGTTGNELTIMHPHQHFPRILHHIWTSTNQEMDKTTPSKDVAPHACTELQPCIVQYSVQVCRQYHFDTATYLCNKSSLFPGSNARPGAVWGYAHNSSCETLCGGDLNDKTRHLLMLDWLGVAAVGNIHSLALQKLLLQPMTHILWLPLIIISLLDANAT